MNDFQEGNLDRLYEAAIRAKKPAVLNGKQLICPHGMKAYTVDGSPIRNHIDSDFFQGSGQSSHFIPRNEIWIDFVVPEKEWPFILLHECTMAENLKRGWSVGRAYDNAKATEDKARKAKRAK